MLLLLRLLLLLLLLLQLLLLLLLLLQGGFLALPRDAHHLVHGHARQRLVERGGRVGQRNTVRERQQLPQRLLLGSGLPLLELGLRDEDGAAGEVADESAWHADHEHLQLRDHVEPHHHLPAQQPRDIRARRG